MENICKCFMAIIVNGGVSFYTSDGGANYIMPYVTNTNYRYNNCPCCGQNIRNILLTRQERNALLK